MTKLRSFTSALLLGPSALAAFALLPACGGGTTTENTDNKDHDGGESSGFTLPFMLGSSSGSGVSGATTGATGVTGQTTGTTSVVSGSSVVSTGPTSTGQTTSSSSEGAPDAGSDVQAPALAAVPLYTCEAYGNVYSVQVKIGTQTFNMDLDTGSTTMGVAGVPCGAVCDVAPEYAPGPTATDTHKTASSVYGSGEWSGEIYEDQVVIGDEPPTPIYFGDITNQNNFFNGTICNSPTPGQQGILGMGPPVSLVAGTDAYFDTLVQTWGIADEFALQLCDTSGTMWFGGYDATHTTGAPQYTPLVQSFAAGYFYAVNLVSIGVNGKTVPVAVAGAPDSAIDTGTSLFIVSQQVANELGTAIGSDPTFQSVFGLSSAAMGESFFTSGSCAQLSQTKAELDAMLPALTLNMGTDAPIVVNAVATESYLWNAGGGQWCSSISVEDLAGQLGLASIMGAPMLKSNVLIIDRQHTRIGFAPHTPCN
jgi:hypothetical protein